MVGRHVGYLVVGRHVGYLVVGRHVVVFLIIGFSVTGQQVLLKSLIPQQPVGQYKISPLILHNFPRVGQQVRFQYVPQHPVSQNLFPVFALHHSPCIPEMGDCKNSAYCDIGMR